MFKLGQIILLAGPGKWLIIRTVRCGRWMVGASIKGKNRPFSFMQFKISRGYILNVFCLTLFIKSNYPRS